MRCLVQNVKIGWIIVLWNCGTHPSEHRRLLYPRLYVRESRQFYKTTKLCKLDVPPDTLAWVIPSHSCASQYIFPLSEQQGVAGFLFLRRHKRKACLQVLLQNRLDCENVLDCKHPFSYKLFETNEVIRTGKPRVAWRPRNTWIAASRLDIPRSLFSRWFHRF